MKATEDGDFVDKSFKFNWLEAKAAGIPRARLFRMETPFDLLTLLAGTRILLYTISLETDSRFSWMRQALPTETIGL